MHWNSNKADKKMIGQVFGFLTVLYKTDERDNRNVVWKCRCECGSEVGVRYSSLKAGDKKSCGCKTKAETSGTHGMYGTPTHNTWRSMRDRCKPDHKSYDNYKHINIDPKWLDNFESFLDDMGERPEGKTLDRKDNSLGYNKDNCRWANLSTQQQNKRVSERNINGYPGIFESHGKFAARIRCAGQRIYLGCFPTAELAHIAYDAKGRELFGDEWKSYFTEVDKNDEYCG